MLLEITYKDTSQLPTSEATSVEIKRVLTILQVAAANNPPELVLSKESRQEFTTHVEFLKRYYLHLSNQVAEEAIALSKENTNGS